MPKRGIWNNWKNRTVFVSNGLLNPHKGIEFAIPAINFLKDEFPSILYAVVGIPHPLGGNDTKIYYQDLKDLVKKYNVSNHVTFYERFVDKYELLAILNNARGFICPYSSEIVSSSATITMALSTGVAIFSTPFPYSRYVLQNHRGIYTVNTVRIVKKNLFFDSRPITASLSAKADL